MGSALWIVDYTFSKTGRKVKNVIYSSFEIKDGKIFKQTENFDFKAQTGIEFVKDNRL